MNGKTKWIAAGALAAALVGGATGIAVATGGGDDNDAPITGGALERAKAAALAETGGGRVTETEVGDEEGYYEVEVTLADGSQVDVHLDEQFRVTSQQADEDHPDDTDDGGT